MKQIPVLIGSLIIILGVGGFFVYSQFLAPEEERAVSENKNIGDAGVSLDLSKGSTSTSEYSIDVLPEDAQEQPSLSRAIVFGESIPQNVRDVLTERVANIQEKLRADASSGSDWLELGILYHTANDYQGAREVWEFLTKVSPGNATALDNLGKLYHYNLKDYPKAESYFRKSLSVDPDSLIPYFELHDLYRYSYRQDTNAAVNILEDALRKFPEQVGIYLMMGRYHAERGDVDKARAAFTDGLNRARDIGNVALIEEFGREIEYLN